MSVQDVLEIANKLSREEKTILGAQIAGDFSVGEVAEIRLAIAKADAEFERGECLSSADLARQLGL